MRTWTPFILLLTVLFLIADIAAADDCDAVNLITAKDSPFEKIPVLNQGSVNICYAYTASQMADYYLIKNGAQARSLHAGWVALSYALSKNRKGIEIGHTREALEEIVRIGNCDFEKVAAVWSALPPTDLKKRSPTELLKFFESSCPAEGRTALSLPKAKLYNYKLLPDDASYENFIRQNLTEAAAPFSISYCANIWKSPDYVGLGLTAAGVRDRVLKGCHYHESLVVGKKLIGGACHFLVRNTWGPKWPKNNQKLKCLCRNRTTGETIDECDSVSYSGEEFSVEACYFDSKALSRNVGQITVFESELRADKIH